MSTTLACDYNNDIYLDSDGNLAIKTDLEAILQNCRTAVQVWKGECVLNLTRGLPYEEKVFERIQSAQFEAAARALLLTVDGVNSVPSFTITTEKNTLSYTATLDTDYGSTTLNG